MSLNERKDKTGRIKEVDLGLSESETQAIAEFRRLSADNEDLNDMRDATLARYLRFNSWKVEPAIKQMTEYLAWRKANNIDRILDNADFPSREIIRTIVPYAYHESDKDGRPIYIEKTGMIATAALADEKICNPEHFMHSHIYGVEYMQKKMYESSLARGERINGITTILDMTGLGFHHRQCLFVLKNAMDFDQKYYPEYLSKLYVINAPWVAPFLFTAVKVFLDEVTISRIQLISGDPSEFLLSVISPENLPKEYGGTAATIEVFDSSSLKAQEVSGLDQQDISYDFEKIVSSSTGANETFTYYFEVEHGYDIDFSIELLPANGQMQEDETKKTFVQKVERLKMSRGHFKAPYANAKLLFRWDNNFSYFTSKQIKYSITCMNDESNSIDGILGSVQKESSSSSSGSSSSSSSSSK